MSDKTKIYILRNIEDYSGSAPQDQDTMKWNSSGSYWEPVGGIGDINDLVDVDITTPANNSLLKYDEGSGDWIDTLIGLDYLDDVNIPSPQDGWSLFYNNGTSKWEGAMGSGSSAAQLLHEFNELIDTSGSDFDTVHGFVSGTLRVTHEGARLSNDDFWEKGSLDGFYTSFLVTGGEEVIADYARPTSGSIGSVGNANAVKLQNRNISADAPTDSEFLGWNPDSSEWEPKTLQRVAVFTVGSELTLGQSGVRFYFPFSSGSLKATRIRAAVDVAPTGATIQVELRRYNSSGSVGVGTATISTSAYTGSNSSLSNEYLAAGYWWQISILQVGSTIVGSDLTFQVIGTLLGVT